MKKIVLVIAALTILFLTGINQADATVDTKYVCFTMTPDKYPALASPSAPIVVLNTDADPVQLYSQFQLLTRGERVKFFSALNDSNKSKVWLVHFNNFSLSHDLTAEQQAYIDDTVSLLRKNDFASLKGQSSARTAQAIQLFGKELAWELVAHLGGKSPFADNRQLANYVLPGVGSFNVEPCDCYSDGNSTFCNPGYICLSNGMTYPCTESSWGCGWLWLDNCNGKCRYNIWG